MSFIKFIYRTLKETFVEQERLAIIRKRFPSVIIEKNVYFKGDIRNLELGNRVIFQSGTVVHLGGMEWCEYKGHLVIGDESVISPNCVIYAAGPGGIEIGERFDCGPGVGIFACRTDYSKGMNYHVFAPVHIGNNVTVYANAVISPGVKIGDGAVVAAGAVVVSNVMENTLVCGIPARVIKKGVKKVYVPDH